MFGHFCASLNILPRYLFHKPDCHLFDARGRALRSTYVAIISSSVATASLILIILLYVSFCSCGHRNIFFKQTNKNISRNFFSLCLSLNVNNVKNVLKCISPLSKWIHMDLFTLIIYQQSSVIQHQHMKNPVVQLNQHLYNILSRNVESHKCQRGGCGGLLDCIYIVKLVLCVSTPCVSLMIVELSIFTTVFLL